MDLTRPNPADSFQAERSLLLVAGTLKVTPFTEPPYNCFGIGHWNPDVVFRLHSKTVASGSTHPKVSQLRNLDVQRDVEKLRNAEIGDFLMTEDLLVIFVDGG